MKRSVRVHHFVVVGLARPQDPAWRVCDLFRVSHWLDVPADTEFPFTVPRIHVFTRFYPRRAKPTEVLVRVSWLAAPGGVARVIGQFGPFTIPFTHDATAHDCSFNLHNVRLQGTGIHRVDLLREVKRGWKAGKKARVAKTYFVVEK